MLTTDAVAQKDRLSYWTDMICNTYVQLGCDAVKTAQFRGSIKNHQLPSLDLSIVSACAQTVMRSNRHIAKASEDYFLISIQTEGTGIISQDGRDAVLRPGDFALYDSTRPYQLAFKDNFEQIVLKLPTQNLKTLVKETHKLTATTVSGREGAGHLLISMIRTLRDDVEDLQPASALAVASGVLNIVSAGLHTLPSANQIHPSQLTQYHLARIKAFIDANLFEPELSAAYIAAKLNLSTGHIHRIFQNDIGALGHYILNLRLEACGRELLSPMCQNKSVSAIAYSCGFNSAAHFSRAFKEKFELTPSEWKERATSRMAVRGVGV